MSEKWSRVFTCSSAELPSPCKGSVSESGGTCRNVERLNSNSDTTRLRRGVGGTRTHAPADLIFVRKASQRRGPRGGPIGLALYLLPHIVFPCFPQYFPIIPQRRLTCQVKTGGNRGKTTKKLRKVVNYAKKTPRGRVKASVPNAIAKARSSYSPSGAANVALSNIDN